MSITVDAKGLQCPEPVIKIKNALAEIDEGIITVYVDSVASKDNVERFAKSQGCTVEITKKEDYFQLQIVKGFACGMPKTGEENKDKEKSNKVVFVSSDSIGEDRELGTMLITGFIKNILEVEKRLLPSKIIFVNSGVKIACFNQDAIESLKQLEQKGVEIYSCGVCLKHFNIEDKLKVGKVGNAYDTVYSLLDGESVINLC
jgi:selenium metabolism protein YedF